MTSTLFIIQIVLAILITISVLLQKSSSIGLGAYSGSNESVFGAKGPAGFLTKATFILGLLFVINTLALGYFYSQENTKSAVDVVKSEIPAPAKNSNSAIPAANVNSNSTSKEKSSLVNTSGNAAEKANKDASSINSSVAKTENADKKEASTNEDSKKVENSSNTKSDNALADSKANSNTKTDNNTNLTNTQNETNSNSSSTNSSTETNNKATNDATDINNNNKSAKQNNDIEAKIASVLKEHKIKFESDSAMLTSDSIDTIKAIVLIIKEQPDVKVEIGGYTDSDGNAEYNKKLSQQRVDVVKKALVDFGLNADNLKAVGYGAANPLVNNDSAENKAKNRRVEFKVIK